MNLVEYSRVMIMYIYSSLHECEQANIFTTHFAYGVIAIVVR